MSFHAYPATGSVTMSHEHYDEANGVLGRLVSKSASVGEADTLEGATEIAYAHLGRAPSEGVYIADDDDVVRKVVFNDAYHKERQRDERNIGMALSLLILCLTAFIGTVALGLGIAGLLAFVVNAGVYIAVVLTGIQNEVEGGMLCFIYMILSFLIIAAITW